MKKWKTIYAQSNYAINFSELDIMYENRTSVICPVAFKDLKFLHCRYILILDVNSKLDSSLCTQIGYSESTHITEQLQSVHNNNDYYMIWPCRKLILTFLTVCIQNGGHYLDIGIRIWNQKKTKSWIVQCIEHSDWYR